MRPCKALKGVVLSDGVHLENGLILERKPEWGVKFGQRVIATWDFVLNQAATVRPWSEMEALELPPEEKEGRESSVDVENLNVVEKMLDDHETSNPNGICVSHRNARK